MAKEKAKATILALAERGAPLLDSMVENGSPLAFNTVSMQAMVHGTETPAMDFIEGAPDSLGLICWLLRDQMLAKINAAIDEVADDKQALSQQQRDIAESEIGNSVLMIERAECALIWHAEAAGEVIVFVAARARRRYSAFSFERLRASAPTDRAAITPSTLCIPPSNSGDERIRIVAEPAAS